MTATQTNNLSSADTETLNGVLAELDALEGMSDDAVEEIAALDELEDLVLAEVVEEPVDEPAEEPAAAALADDELEELELAVEKAEIYNSQASTVSTGDANGEIKAEGTANVAPPKRAAASGPSVPRVARDLNSVPADLFVLTGDASTMADADKHTAKVDILALRPGQKKVAEKFDNLFLSMAAGAAPSKYILTAFGALDAKKELSSSDVIAAFKASGVGEGTARSQSTQMMSLFPVIGVAERDGKALKLKDDSNVAAYLRKHIAA